MDQLFLKSLSLLSLCGPNFYESVFCFTSHNDALIWHQFFYIWIQRSSYEVIFMLFFSQFFEYFIRNHNDIVYDANILYMGWKRFHTYHRRNPLNIILFQQHIIREQKLIMKSLKVKQYMLRDDLLVKFTLPSRLRPPSKIMSTKFCKSNSPRSIKKQSVLIETWVPTMVNYMILTGAYMISTSILASLH